MKTVNQNQNFILIKLVYITLMRRKGVNFLRLNNSVELEIKKGLNNKHAFLLWFVVRFGSTPPPPL